MRKKERSMEEEQAIFLLKNGEYGILSTIDPENRPYGIPVNYAFKDNSIYIHCAMEGKKIDCFNSKSEVSFCVVGYSAVDAERFTSRYKSCIINGRIEEVFSDEKIMALEELIKKYSPQFFEKGMKYIKADEHKTKIFKIEIEAISGKSNIKCES